MNPLTAFFACAIIYALVVIGLMVRFKNQDESKLITREDLDQLIQERAEDE